MRTKIEIKKVLLTQCGKLDFVFILLYPKHEFSKNFEKESENENNSF